MVAFNVVIFIFLVILLTTVSTNDLSSTSVAEPCISTTSTDALKTLWAFSNFLGFYYVPMGSEHYYRSNLEVLKGRSARSQMELDTMNLRIQIMPDYFIVTKGFGGKYYFTQQCIPATILNITNFVATLDDNDRVLLRKLSNIFHLNGVTQGVCIPPFFTNLFNNPVTNVLLFSTSYEYIVLEDISEGAILITRCVTNQYGDWKVMSLKPTVSNEFKLRVYKKLKEIGFNPRFY